ncbi:MAG: hypothetical protein M1812_002689 [Candelaria pacifica]|nr:MAG: hypothetical protein M1812_002689 [Candelaria pacifica]
MVWPSDSAVLSRRRLQDLRKGPQATVFLGVSLATRVVVYSSVWKNVLNHFSPYCKQRLELEKNTFIWVKRGGSKDHIKFAIDWMVCGGKDSRNKFSTMDVDELLDLFEVVDLLQIKILKEQVLHFLEKGLQRKKFGPLLSLLETFKALGGDAIHKAVSDELCIQIRGVTPTIEQVQSIYDNTTVGSNLRTALAHRIAPLILGRKISGTPYVDYSLENKEFDIDMENAMGGKAQQEHGKGAPPTAPTGPKNFTRFQAPPVCGSCKKVGHVEAACFVLYPELIPAKHGASKGCTRCMQSGHLANECFKPFCTHCERVGHIENKCYVLHPEQAPPRAAPISCSHCGKAGHVERNCWKSHHEMATSRIEVAVPAGNSSKNTNGSKKKVSYTTKKSDTPSTTASLLAYLKPRRK